MVIIIPVDLQTRRSGNVPFVIIAKLYVPQISTFLGSLTTDP